MTNDGQRLYHLVAINERSGAKVRLTAYPMPHADGVRLKGKFTPHPARRIQLEEVRAD